MEKSKTDIVSVEHQPGDPPLQTDTDWDAVNALTDEDIQKAVDSDPDAAPINFFELPGFTQLVNARKLREKLGLTQEEFASTYGIPMGTLRDWEQGRKNPDATARTYLRVIARNPQAVAEWQRSAA